MPKLRNASTDLGKFAQWLGRKCRNHNPLAELKMANRESMPRMYQSKTKGDVTVLADDENVILYEAGGRTFEITVQEVDPETHAGKERLKVGY